MPDGGYLAQALALIEAASEALADESGMVVCWHEWRTRDELLKSGCPQCLVDAALNDLRSEEVARALDDQITSATEALNG